MSMESRVVVAGAVAGLAAGVVAAVVSMVAVEPHINAAIAYEELRSAVESGHAAADDGHSHSHGEGAGISRTAQSTIGVLLSVGLFGMAVGLVVAIAAYALGRLLPGLATRWCAVASAGLTFFAAYLVPFAKYPTNPPAVGDSGTVLQRSIVYFGMVAISVMAMVIAVVVARRIARSFGWWNASLVAAGGYLAVVVIAAALMPSYASLAGLETETPAALVEGGVIVLDGFPADTLSGFRLASMLVSLVLYAGIGVLIPAVQSAMARRTAGQPRPAPAAAPVA